MKSANESKKRVFLAILSWMMFSIFMVMPVKAEDSTAEESVTFDIKIVHTNDIHARVEENGDNQIIGMDRLSGIINQFKINADASLVLDSGDTFHGQSIATLVKGESVARLMKACGYDAMTPGNHDWSYGKDRLKELGTLSDLKMLAGNITDESGNSFFDDTNYIKEITKDGKTLKIGVFGVIDPQMHEKTTPSNVEGLIFQDPVVYATTAAQQLRQEGCDIVIALSHTLDPQGLAKQVNGVDLWLCGHEHVDINTSVTTPDGSTAYISESGYYLYSVGLIDLNCVMDPEGNVSFTYQKNLLQYEQALAYEKNPEVTALLETINAENAVELNREVGTSPVELDGIWEHIRIGQTNLGNVVTDAYLKTTGADIAIENAGGIRASVEAGKVTYGDIIDISPYGNYIVTKKLTGKQLKEMMEISLDIQQRNIVANDSGDWDAWPNDSGSYLQIGGMSVEYDPTQSTGNRIVSMKIGNTEYDENREYVVAVNNYLGESDSYPQLAAAEEIGEFSACDESLIAFFQQGEEEILNSAQSERLVKSTKEAPEETKPENPEIKDPASNPTEDKITTSSDEKAEADKNKSATIQKTSTVKSVKTGDQDNAGIWMAVLLSGSVGIVYVGRGRKKR